MIEFSEIQKATKRISGKAIYTPLLCSPYLNEIAGRRIWVKAECLQITNSFKYRGALNSVAQIKDVHKANGILAYSSGNHAQGVAYAARQAGIPATIVMPSDAPAIKIANTKALGAKVITYDRQNEEREDVAKRVDPDEQMTLITPFDTPSVIEGQGTIGVEIAEQAARYGIKNAQVLTCCGGGGLTAGIATALASLAPDFTVHPIEPEGFDDVYRSMKSGEIEENDKRIGSIQDAILTPRPSEMTFEIIQRLCKLGFVVSDQDTLKTIALAFHRLRIVLEPGGAAALSAALFHSENLEAEDIIVTASGGNVDDALFIKAINDFGSPK